MRHTINVCATTIRFDIENCCTVYCVQQLHGQLTPVHQWQEGVVSTAVSIIVESSNRHPFSTFPEQGHRRYLPQPKFEMTQVLVQILSMMNIHASVKKAIVIRSCC